MEKIWKPKNCKYSVIVGEYQHLTSIEKKYFKLALDYAIKNDAENVCVSNNWIFIF